VCVCARALDTIDTLAMASADAIVCHHKRANGFVKQEVMSHSLFLFFFFYLFLSLSLFLSRAQTHTLSSTYTLSCRKRYEDRADGERRERERARAQRESARRERERERKQRCVFERVRMLQFVVLSKRIQAERRAVDPKRKKEKQDKKRQKSAVKARTV